MKAADSSCRTWTNRIFSWRWRRDTMIPLMPSPGMPKIVSTPQSMSVSMSTSAAVVATVILLGRYSAFGPRVRKGASGRVCSFPEGRTPLWRVRKELLARPDLLRQLQGALGAGVERQEVQARFRVFLPLELAVQGGQEHLQGG